MSLVFQAARCVFCLIHASFVGHLSQCLLCSPTATLLASVSTVHTRVSDVQHQRYMVQRGPQKKLPATLLSKECLDSFTSFTILLIK